MLLCTLLHAQTIYIHSHGRFSQGGDKLIESLDPLEFLVITNTLPHRDANGQLSERQPTGKVSTDYVVYIDIYFTSHISSSS
jgi:hypothetical protein